MTTPLRTGTVLFEKTFGRDYAWTDGNRMPDEVSLLAETLAEAAVEVRGKIVALTWVDGQACVVRVAGDRLDHCGRLAATAAVQWLPDFPRATSYVVAALEGAMQTTAPIDPSALVPPSCTNPAPRSLTNAIRLGLPVTVPLALVPGLGDTPTDRYRGFVFSGEKARWSPLLRGLLTINFTAPGRSPEQHATAKALEAWAPTEQLWSELDKLDTDTAQTMVRYGADPTYPEHLVPKDGRADRVVAALMARIPDGKTRVRTLRTTLAPRRLSPELLGLAIPQVSSPARSALAHSLSGAACTLANSDVDELDEAGLLTAFVPIKALPADTLERRPATIATMLEADGVASADMDFLLDRPDAQITPTLAASSALAVAHGIAAPRNALLRAAHAGDEDTLAALAPIWGGLAAALFDTLQGRWATDLVAADAKPVIQTSVALRRRRRTLTRYLVQASTCPLPPDWHGILQGVLTANEIRELVLVQPQDTRAAMLAWVRDVVGTDSPFCATELDADDPWLETLLAAEPWTTLTALAQGGSLRGDLSNAERIASLLTQLDCERELCVHALAGAGVLPRLERIRPAVFRAVMSCLDPTQVYATVVAGPPHGVAADPRVWTWLGDALPGPPARPARTQIQRHGVMLHAMYQQTHWPSLCLDIQARRQAVRALEASLGLEPSTREIR